MIRTSTGACENRALAIFRPAAGRRPEGLEEFVARSLYIGNWQSASCVMDTVRPSWTAGDALWTRRSKLSFS
ncbi:MAG: hypothetical protein QXI12_08165 [Candidatus Methanomethyliaceae archaeon]